MADFPPTLVRSPWALIRRGGDQPGKRPSTCMAYLVRVVAKNGQLQGYHGFTLDDRMRSWSAGWRSIPAGTVIRQWIRQPSVAMVKQQKALLMPLRRSAA